MKRPRSLDEFFSALFFLTTIYLPIHVEFDASRIKRFFPIVGLVVGLVVASFDLVFSKVLSSSVVSFMDVVVFILLTGGLHLDGLGDAADGIFSGASPERALEIMKDSRVGIMGVLAVVCVIGIKWGGIFDIHTKRFLSLCIVPAYSRTAMLLGMKFLPYCRKEGTGKGFFDAPISLSTFYLFFPLVLLSLMLGWGAIVFNMAFLTITGALILFYRKRLGCITGDTLGAMCEVVEALLFLTLAMVL